MIIDGTSGDDHFIVEDLAGDDLLCALLDGNDIFEAIRIEQSVTLYGGNGNDILYAYITSHGSGQTILEGGAGDDVLYAVYAGLNPLLRGGAGHDEYTITNPDHAVLIENPGEGFDSVYVFMTDSTNPADQVFRLPENFEVMWIEGSLEVAATTYANAFSNTIVLNGGYRVTTKGLNGHDEIIGWADHARVFAGNGNDYIDVSGDRVYIEGGNGYDTYSLSGTSEGHPVIIADFNSSRDLIELTDFAALTNGGILSAANFRLGAGAADANDYIIFNATTGAVFYDSNGNAAGGKVQIAELTVTLGPVSNTDFFVA